MSPRAAWRLESLGFERVYDYVPGKADWLAYGLPHEGNADLIAPLVTADVPTCGVHERLGAVRDRLDASRFGMLVVLNAEGVVLGRLGRSALDAGDDTAVDELMREGPATVRPSEEAEPLLERMVRADVDGVIVTSSDGRLLGVFQREQP